jgi:TRAP-type uncharacterized transport system fused permease subunit
MTAEEKKQRRIQRQRMFKFRVTLTFVAFCLVAAPLQFHIDWYSGFSNGKADWLSASLKSAPLYFYALVLCIEAFLRLEHYPSLLKNDRRVILLRLFLLVPVLAFLFQYFVTPFYKNAQPLPEIELWIQMITGSIAFMLSTLVHKEIIKQEIRRIR